MTKLRCGAPVWTRRAVKDIPAGAEGTVLKATDTDVCIHFIGRDPHGDLADIIRWVPRSDVTTEGEGKQLDLL